MPGKHNQKELQKTATLCTAHKLRKVLMLWSLYFVIVIKLKVQNIFHGRNNITLHYITLHVVQIVTT